MPRPKKGYVSVVVETIYVDDFEEDLCEVIDKFQQLQAKLVRGGFAAPYVETDWGICGTNPKLLVYAYRPQTPKETAHNAERARKARERKAKKKAEQEVAEFKEYTRLYEKFGPVVPTEHVKE